MFGLKSHKSLLTLALSLALSAGSVQTLHAELVAKGSFATISTSALDETQVARLTQTADDAIRATQTFVTSMGLSANLARNPEIRIYDDRQKLLHDAPSNVAQNPGSLGFFDHDSGRIGVWYGGNTDEVSIRMRHELVHHVLHSSSARELPAWLDEGLAEILSRNPEALGSGKVRSIAAVYKYSLASALKAGTAPHLSDLFNIKHEAFYGSGQDLRYAASYALVAYLLNNQGQRVLGNVIDQAHDANWFKAQIANGDLEKFERDFYAWVAK